MTVDFDFRITRVVNGLSSQVQRRVLLPVTGRCRDDEAFEHSIHRLVSNWRVRLSQLRSLGWTQVQDQKFGFARNCRPASVDLAENQDPRTCRLRICPFCQARFAGNVFRRLRAVLDQSSSDIGLLSWLVNRRQDCGFDRTAEENQAWIRDNLAYRKMLRKRLPKSVMATAEFVAMSPVSGVARHALLALLPASTEPATGRSVKWSPQPSNFELVRLIARTFRYPREWLYGDAERVLEWLTALGRRRTVVTTGAFRRRSEFAPVRTTTTPRRPRSIPPITDV